MAIDIREGWSLRDHADPRPLVEGDGMIAVRSGCWLMVTALGLLVPVAAFAQNAQAEIVKNNEKFTASFNKGDVAAVAALYGEDAIAFPP
jgi:hypothetical protein